MKYKTNGEVKIKGVWHKIISTWENENEVDIAEPIGNQNVDVLPYIIEDYRDPVLKIKEGDEVRINGKYYPVDEIDGLMEGVVTVILENGCYGYISEDFIEDIK